MQIILIALYLLSISLANIITASTAPLSLGIFMVPAGSFLIGATFILRDFLQQAVGRNKTYAYIAAALLLSSITSYLLGDTLWIVFASAVTFVISETLDTEIYSRLKQSMSLKVMYSGIIGGAVDSLLFVIIGLSPIGAGFLTWDQVGYAILGQITVKIAMQLLGAGFVAYISHKCEQVSTR